MAKEDSVKWDAKFRAKPELLAPRAPSALLVKYLKSSDGKRALDVACGGGRHTYYMAELGYEVDAIDISKVAIASLNRALIEKNISNVHTEVMDMDHFKAVDESYGVIVMSNYLNRALISELKRALMVDGVLFIESYMEDKSNEKRGSKRENLLASGELKSFFDSHFDILEYSEFDNEPYELYRMKKSAIVVRKRLSMLTSSN